MQSNYTLVANQIYLYRSTDYNLLMTYTLLFCVNCYATNISDTQMTVVLKPVSFKLVWIHCSHTKIYTSQFSTVEKVHTSIRYMYTVHRLSHDHVLRLDHVFRGLRV